MSDIVAFAEGLWEIIEVRAPRIMQRCIIWLRHGNKGNVMDAVTAKTLTRRRFLKASAVAGGSLAAGKALGLGAGARAATADAGELIVLG